MKQQKKMIRKHKIQNDTKVSGKEGTTVGENR